MSEHDHGQTRRDFLKVGAAAGLGAAVAGLELEARDEEPRLARRQVAVQGRPRSRPSGSASSASAAWARPMSRTTSTSRASRSRPSATSSRRRSSGPRSGSSTPASRSRRDTPRARRDFERMCATEDLDLVMTATPWEWHVPVCVAAMENGKHAVTEVPAAMRLDDCWELVETAEKTGQHCQMMENCCYDRIELMTLNLVRKGVLGEVLHAEAGYLHDLREVKFSKEGRGAVAAGLVPEAQRQPLSDPRPRPRRPVHEHQPRRRFRLPRLVEQPDPRPPRIRRREVRARLARRPARDTSWATSTPA